MACRTVGRSDSRSAQVRRGSGGGEGRIAAWRSPVESRESGQALLSSRWHRGGGGGGSGGGGGVRRRPGPRRKREREREREKEREPPSNTAAAAVVIIVIVVIVAVAVVAIFVFFVIVVLLPSRRCVAVARSMPKRRHLFPCVASTTHLAADYPEISDRPSPSTEESRPLRRT
ncbi:PREDICTED: uncharacterized protein LOC108747553 [Trachymyrmex septentrionalis]|uniref:uncharacterized protein LOC108747553 n=1 Tax=Trachymyrmex septentrionalis TaxID=34720 RepID=UPI00084F566C|nr:PREDICTED: uncharacterized protein LOC108747553 [Trachymyrmex septentrionalis]